MITEIPLTEFKHKLNNSSLDYPQCNCQGQECPKTFFNILSIGSRQSGKTYTLAKLLKHYEMNKLKDKEDNIHPMRVIVISPTFDANPIYKSLKTLDEENDVYTDYSDELLNNILTDIKNKKEETDNFKKYELAYKILDKTHEKDLPQLYERSPEVFKILEEYNYELPSKIPQPTYYEYPCNFLVLDDLLGTGSFNSKKNSVLMNAFIKNRHLGVNFCILVQSCKGVPKTIRLNSSVFHLCRFANKRVILEDIYPEVSNILTEEQFEELYNTGTEEKYGSIIVDCTHKEKRFLKSLDSELFIS